MITKLIVRNFKRFTDVEIELGNPVVFIGPNNSGKTSALQALALWEAGLRRWNEKRKGVSAAENRQRPGVTISRSDLTAVPVPGSNLLWRNLHVRNVQRIEGKQDTKNIRIDIVVEGITADKPWQCGLEFDYANEESFYCRPLRLSEAKNPGRMRMPPEAGEVRVAFLPPMSGLRANELRLDTGAINVAVGEGRTAEVLRNLCYKVYKEYANRWGEIKDQIKALFGVELDPPQYISERGEIAMSYREKGVKLDLSSSGRGLQQTLLLLAYMYANPDAVLLLDEPDAHLEMLRQGQVYQLLTDVSRKNGNQIIAASHSEILLKEAAGRDVVVAFIGKKPHRIDGRGSQEIKALKDIGYEHYVQAEQKGWVLYLEGSTDLAILRVFAEKLQHKKAQVALEQPFFHYVGNQPNKVREHFYGLRAAYRDLRGIAIFDKLQQKSLRNLGALGLMWQRREIENYLCYPETLEAYAQHTTQENIYKYPLFAASESEKRVSAMKESIREIESARETAGVSSPWDTNTKVSDEFLPRLFDAFFKKLGLSNIMMKTNYHELAFYLPLDKIDSEVSEKLDAIVKVADEAKPLE